MSDPPPNHLDRASTPEPTGDGDPESTSSEEIADSAVDDDDTLYRRIQKVEASIPRANVIYDRNRGYWRPTKLAMLPDRDGTSVYLDSLLAALRLTAQHVADEEDPEKYTVGYLNAGTARQAPNMAGFDGIALRVISDPRVQPPPRPCDDAHALLRGWEALPSKGAVKRVGRELAEAARLTEDLGEPHESECVG